MGESICGSLSVSKLNKLSCWLKNNPQGATFVSEARSKIKSVRQDISEIEFQLEQEKFAKKKHIRQQNALHENAKVFMIDSLKEKIQIRTAKLNN